MTHHCGSLGVVDKRRVLDKDRDGWGVACTGKTGAGRDTYPHCFVLLGFCYFTSVRSIFSATQSMPFNSSFTIISFALSSHPSLLLNFSHSLPPFIFLYSAFIFCNVSSFCSLSTYALIFII